MLVVLLSEDLLLVFEHLFLVLVNFVFEPLIVSVAIIALSLKIRHFFPLILQCALGIPNILFVGIQLFADQSHLTLLAAELLLIIV